VAFGLKSIVATEVDAEGTRRIYMLSLLLRFYLYDIFLGSWISGMECLDRHPT